MKRLGAAGLLVVAMLLAAGVGCGTLEKAGKDIDHGLHRGQRDTQGALYGSNADDALNVANSDGGAPTGAIVDAGSGRTSTVDASR